MSHRRVPRGSQLHDLTIGESIRVRERWEQLRGVFREVLRSLPTTCTDPIPLVGGRDVEPRSHRNYLRLAGAHGLSSQPGPGLGADANGSGRNIRPRVKHHSTGNALREAAYIRSALHVRPIERLRS